MQMSLLMKIGFDHRIVLTTDMVIQLPHKKRVQNTEPLFA
jgi:hypothetical protein